MLSTGLRHTAGSDADGGAVCLGYTRGASHSPARHGAARSAGAVLRRWLRTTSAARSWLKISLLLASLPSKSERYIIPSYSFHLWLNTPPLRSSALAIVPGCLSLRHSASLSGLITNTVLERLTAISGNMSSSQCLRRLAASGAAQRPASLLTQSSKSARSLLRAPAAARSLSYAAKPSWSSYSALQSQYVWIHRRISRATTNAVADNLPPPTSRASSACLVA